MSTARNNFLSHHACVYLSLHLWLVHSQHPSISEPQKDSQSPTWNTENWFPWANKDHAWKELVSETVSLFLIVIGAGTCRRIVVPLVEELSPSETDCSWKFIRRLCFSQTWCKRGAWSGRVAASLRSQAPVAEEGSVFDKINFVQVWKLVIHMTPPTPKPPPRSFFTQQQVIAHWFLSNTIHTYKPDFQMLTVEPTRSTRIPS